jgi:hypothetical protein
MVVIGHEAIRMHSPAGLLACLNQGLEEVVAIDMLQENGSPGLRGS